MPPARSPRPARPRRRSPACPPALYTYGDTFALSAGSGVTWSASGAAAVGSSGKVTVTGTGKVTITATKPRDNNHYAAEDQITFTAVPKALTVTGLTAEDRAYDGTNAVQITGVTLNGIVSGDNVSVNLARLTLPPSRSWCPSSGGAQTISIKWLSMPTPTGGFTPRKYRPSSGTTPPCGALCLIC